MTCRARIFLIAFLTMTAALTGNAMAQSCGSPYSIQSGDTLSSISYRVYGNPDRWYAIYSYRDNPRIIGSNAHRVNIGDQIAIPPCLNANPLPPPREDGAPRNDGFQRTIELLTGTYQPFSGEKWQNKGLVTHLINRAFSLSDLGVNTQTFFIDDWPKHLPILLKMGKFDMGFPWIKPNCDLLRGRTLDADTKLRCDEFVWSDPIYTFSIVLFTSKERANLPTSFSDLKGSRICRPAGYYVFDLLEKGLVDGETVTLVRPATPAGCFEALAKEQVDYVSLNRFTGQLALHKAHMERYIQPLMSLVDSRSLHLVAHNLQNEAAFTWMASFNQGLQRLRNTREYDQIVAYHLNLFQNQISDQ